MQESIHWNYTSVLNVVFLAVSAALMFRFLRTGGPAMMREMDNTVADPNAEPHSCCAPEAIAAPTHSCCHEEPKPALIHSCCCSEQETTPTPVHSCCHDEPKPIESIPAHHHH